MKASSIFVFTALSGVGIACTSIGNTIMTFYGYPDNSPPGPAIAHNCGRGYTAGGTGTYSDPLSMATAPGELNVCEIIYVPYLKKYVRYEDDCEQCETDWKSGQRHIDIWTGSSSKNGGQNQINCEDALTPDGKIGFIRNPSSSYGVDSSALYNNGNCATSKEYPNNPNSNYC